MVIQKLFSQRKRDAEKDGTEVYKYDEIATPIRAQIKFIWDEAIGPYSEVSEFHITSSENNKGWENIRHQVRKSKGVLTLSNKRNPKEDCIGYLFKETKVDEWLDIVEVSFRYIDLVLSHDNYPESKGITKTPKDAIDELNHFFQESDMGYQYENGFIIRIDNQMIHSQIVKPALQFLSDPRFSGPQEEFLNAHAHYRKGEYKDANTDALNALESTMKTICDLNGWSYEKGSTASVLLKVLRKNKFFPDYLSKSFEQLVATMISGLPKIRNQEGGHGQGAKPKQTPSYVAGYALHLAAAKILFLSEIFLENEK